ncbi:MAG TPA: type II toxin-antitoxin system RelE/ParE family toxin, partial [Flavobacterium sp.]
DNNDGSFRTYFVYDYMISYQITSERIQILRVRHTSRKPKKH